MDCNTGISEIKKLFFTSTFKQYLVVLLVLSYGDIAFNKKHVRTLFCNTGGIECRFFSQYQYYRYRYYMFHKPYKCC